MGTCYEKEQADPAPGVEHEARIKEKVHILESSSAWGKTWEKAADKGYPTREKFL